jgi:thymidylate kinase
MLTVIEHVLDEMHRMEIRYCHWKSNVRVAQSVLGQTDMDILVDTQQRMLFHELLCRHGFKKVRSPLWQSYPGIEDYLGFDTVTGGQTHFHVHYTLILGEPMLKSYHFPWEERLLADRVFDKSNRIYTSAPYWEILLLLVRWSLKLDGRDRASPSLREQKRWASYFEEYDWLRERVDPAHVASLAQELLGSEVAMLVTGMLQQDPSPASLAQLRRLLYSSFATYARLTPFERWYQKTVRSVVRRVARSRFGRYGRIPLKKTLPTTGCIVAIVGIDGSGKSTLVAELTRWLAWKMETHALYLGHGAGQGSWLTERLKQLLRRGGISRKVQAPTTPTTEVSANQNQAKGTLKQAIRAILHALLALSIAHDRLRRIRWAEQLRRKGAVVITDRWVQKQPYRMDCPMLPPLMERHAWLKRLGKWMVRYEQHLYERMAQCAPDLVIRLNITPEKAVARKEDLDLATAQFKANILHSLEFAGNPCIVDIDAEQPFEKVLLEVKRALWQHL